MVDQRLQDFGRGVRVDVDVDFNRPEAKRLDAPVAPHPRAPTASMSPRVWTSSLRIGIPRATALAWMPIDKQAPMADSSISKG